MNRSLPGLLLLVLTGTALGEVIDVRQGTNLAFAIDPDRQVIVVDLLGGLWRLPASGGGATPLIPIGSGVAQPRFDPTGSRVVFQRWVDGQWDLWQLTLANGEYAALTTTDFNEREPEYSADGRQVIFSANRSGEYAIWSLDLDNGGLRQLTDEPGDSHFPSLSPTGELAYVHHIGTRSALKLYRGGPRGTELVETDRRIDSPSWRPGGGVLVFNERVAGRSSDLALYIDADEPVQRQLTRNEDVFVGRPGWLSAEEYVYAADGQLWRRRIASQERTPIHLFAGATVDLVPEEPIFEPLDAPGPHAVRGINGLVRHEASGQIAFSALGDLWLIDDDELVRLTHDAATDAWPDFTPDGEWLIFASDRDGDMEVHQQHIATGQRLQLSAEPGRVFLPRVSADGRFVAFLATAGFGPWDAAALKLIEIRQPFQSVTLATGLYDASELVWQGSRLRLLARDENAQDALARVFDTPAADDPGLPESNREPFLLPEDPALTWRAAEAGAPYVIQAGRLFDGIRDNYTYLVDIHIEGQRITNIVRRGQLPLPERVIDATELTVLPGLIDVHAHMSTVAGAELGRLWLQSGVTTVREVTANAAQAAERAETWDSGQQPGPRLVFGAGGRLARGLAHGLAAQMQRDDERAAELPPVLARGDAGGAPTIAVSTLGLSYQDVISQLSASGAWLPTGLAALDRADPLQGVSGLTSTIERVMRSSGRVAIGSDAPAVPYGSGFHDELALLAARGIPNDQILRWATGGGAVALGLSLQLGTLESGKLADLVIIDGDPLDDISELRRITAVIKGGVVMSGQEPGPTR